jgi:hypothetical protein
VLVNWLRRHPRLVDHLLAYDAGLVQPSAR